MLRFHGRTSANCWSVPDGTDASHALRYGLLRVSARIIRAALWCRLHRAYHAFVSVRHRNAHAAVQPTERAEFNTTTMRTTRRNCHCASVRTP